jgi:hypothetical protein
MSPSLDDLVRLGKIKLWVPDLGPRRQPYRRLFVTGEFQTWAQSLSGERRGRSLLAPRVEIATIAADFVAGEKVVSFIHSISPPRGEGILRVNTTSLRLAGWCPAKQTLILGLGALADETHGPGRRLETLGREVVRIRRDMGVTQWAKGEFYELFRSER